MQQMHQVAEQTLHVPPFKQIQSLKDGTAAQQPVASMVHVVIYACLKPLMCLAQPTQPIDSLPQFDKSFQSQDAHTLRKRVDW